MSNKDAILTRKCKRQHASHAAILFVCSGKLKDLIVCARYSKPDGFLSILQTALSIGSLDFTAFSSLRTQARWRRARKPVRREYARNTGNSFPHFEVQVQHFAHADFGLIR